jgi:hypothetical protein
MYNKIYELGKTTTSITSMNSLAEGTIKHNISKHAFKATN